MWRLSCALAVVIVGLSVGLSAAREWTSSNGKFTIEAEFVAVKKGAVVLEKPDGTYLSVPLDKLSPEDIEFIEAETGESIDFSSPGDDPDAEPTAEDETEPSAPARRPGGPPIVKLKGEKPNDPPGEARRYSDLRWGVKSLAFSANGGLLAAGKPDRSLLMFDLNADRQSPPLEKLESLRSLSSCTFTPDGRKLLVGGATGLIAIWDVSKTGQLKEAGQFVGHVKDVLSIAVSPDSKFALSGGDDKRVRYWQISNGKELAAFSEITEKVKCCHISNDGRTGWATDGETLLKIDLKQERVTTSKLAKSWALGQFAAFSPDSRIVAVGEQYGVRLWDLRSGKELPSLEESEIQWSGAFTPDGTRLITGGSGKVSVWDVKTQRRIAVLSTGEIGYVQSVATSPDNWHVAAAGGSAGRIVLVFRTPKE